VAPARPIRGTCAAPAQEVHCELLLDGCADVNLVSQAFVQQHELRPLEKAELPTTKSFSGQAAYCYGAHELRVRITDSAGVQRETRDVFYAMDTVGPPILLGRPWQKKQGIVMDMSDDRWRYGVGTESISLRSAAEFVGDTADATHVYAVICSAAGATQAPSTGGEYDLPPELRDFESVFDYKDIANLPQPVGAEHPIVLEDGKRPPFRPLYNMSHTELGTLREYLDTAMANGWIRRSESPAGAPVLFVPKKDGTLRLCVDYRGLNDVTVKNRCPLPLISETLDRLSGAKFFSKMDLKDAYHRIPIRQGDEWKTAFRTRYGHFEYLVMPFGLTNAPATFQAYINQALAGLMDTCCVVYLDDILIFSDSREEHTRHLRQVLERLKKHALYASRKKCQFFTSEVEFLGFIVSTAGVAMDPSRIKTIEEWQAPASLHDVQVFLGFANFYRRFIRNYSKVAQPLTALLKGSQNGKKTGEFALSEGAEQAFRQLKEAFTTAPILCHYDPAAPLRIETDASTFAIAGILSQLQEVNGQKDWHPVAFHSRKMIPAEQRYETHDQELMAIVECFKQWRHYLEGAPQVIRVLSDHNNLRGWRNMTALNKRQARWAVFMESFDWQIEYQAGKANPADAPSRRPDYEGEAPAPEHLLPTLQKKVAAWQENESTVIRRVLATARSCVQGVYEAPARQPARPQALSLPRIAVVRALSEEAAYDPPTDTLLDLVREVQTRDEDCIARRAHPPRTEGAQAARWEDRDGLLYKDDRLYLPRDQALVAEVIKRHHDDPLAAHFGRDKTIALLRRKFWWQDLYHDVDTYIRTCDVCQRTKAKRHRPYGEMAALPLPAGPWEEISMDFITDLPPSKWRGVVYDSILVVVDRFTKVTQYIPTNKTVTSGELANLLIDEIFAKYGFPKGIVSDRGSVFTSAFWSEFCYAARVKRKLSTAFHPQTDGQTGRQNQTLEQYLRCYCSDKQDQWAQWLPLAEFASNNSEHIALRMSPFRMLYGYDPKLYVEPRDEAHEERVPAAADRVRGIQEMRDELTERWRRAADAQSKAHDEKHKAQEFAVGDMVMLSAKNLKVREPSRKLSHRFIGPFRIQGAVGTQAYRLSLPSFYRIHNVFHVSLLEPFHKRAGAAAPELRAPELIDGEEEWFVEEILGHKGAGERTQYLVKWKDWPAEYNSYEPQKNLQDVEARVKYDQTRQSRSGRGKRKSKSS